MHTSRSNYVWNVRKINSTSALPKFDIIRSSDPIFEKTGWIFAPPVWKRFRENWRVGLHVFNWQIVRANRPYTSNEFSSSLHAIALENYLERNLTVRQVHYRVCWIVLDYNTASSQRLGTSRAGHRQWEMPRRRYVQHTRMTCGNRNNQGCISRVSGGLTPQEVADPPESSAEPLWGSTLTPLRIPPCLAKPVYLCTTIRRLRLYRERSDLI